MAGTRALGVEVPDEYDVTITSTSDDEKSVRAAAGLEAADGEEGDDDPDQDADGDDADEDQDDADGDGDDADGDEDGEDDGEEEADEAPRRIAKGSHAFEEPVKGETADARVARIERNVQRIQRLSTKVANKDQRIQTLEGEIARLRAGKPAGEKEPDARRETAAEAPKFAFPTFDEWSEQKANEGRTLEEYSDERQDARSAFKAGLTAAETAKERAEATRNAVVQANAARVEEMRELHDDYDDVIATSRAPMTPTMQLTMIQRPYGAAVAYYCSSTPEGLKEAKRIAKLPPIEQVEELGLLGRSKAVRALMPKSATGTPARDDDRPARRKAKPTVEDEDVVDEILTDDDEEEEPPARRSRTRSSRAPRPLPTVAGGARRSRELKDLDTDAYIAQMDEADRKRGKRR